MTKIIPNCVFHSFQRLFGLERAVLDKRLRSGLWGQLRMVQSRRQGVGPQPALAAQRAQQLWQKRALRQHWPHRLGQHEVCAQRQQLRAKNEVHLRGECTITQMMREFDINKKMRFQGKSVAISPKVTTVAPPVVVTIPQCVQPMCPTHDCKPTVRKTFIKFSRNFTVLFHKLYSKQEALLLSIHTFPDPVYWNTKILYMSDLLSWCHYFNIYFYCIT